MNQTIKRVFKTGLMLLIVLGITLPPLQTFAAPPCSPSASSAWQICGPLESSSVSNILQTSVLQANDKTLRMAWTEVVGYPIANQTIFYASRFPNGTWTPGNIVTRQVGSSQFPALAQLNNNTLYLFFSYQSPTSPHSQLYYLTQNGGTFSRRYNPVPLINSTAFSGCQLYGCNDTMPAAAVGRDGTLWLVWTRDNSTLTSSNVMRQLWYKTLRGNVWSTEQPITLPTDVNWNYQPSVVVGRDGIVRVAYSRGVASSANFQIYSLTFNGTGWSSPTQISTQTTTRDDNPSIMQDRNGTFWVFWDRYVTVNSTSSSNTIYERSSIDNGATWPTATETALTVASCPSSGCVDSEYPAAVQSSTDKYIWVFYDTDIGGGLLNIYALQTTKTIAPVHDVMVYSFTTNASLMYQAGFLQPHAKNNGTITLNSPVPISLRTVKVTVKVLNRGDFLENVTLSLTATHTPNYSIGAQTLQIPVGQNATAIFNFNTTGVVPARYGILGNATLIGGAKETVGNRPDSVLSTANTVHVLPLGDVDQSGNVTISDVSVVFFNYDSVCNTPSTCSAGFIAAEWGDVSGNWYIDINDASVAAHDYGMTT